MLGRLAALVLVLVACNVGDDVTTSSQGLAMVADAAVAIELDASPCAGQPEPACPSAPDGYLPQNPGIPGGGQCRGACGAACPASCSVETPVSTCLEWQDAQCGWHAKTCSYPVQRCGSHAGCRTHDSCYDNCATKKTGVLRASCRRTCDFDCLRVYGKAFCESWMGGGKPYDSYIEYTGTPTSTTYDTTCY